MTVAQTFANGLRVPQVQGAIRIQGQRHLILADQPGGGKRQPDSEPVLTPSGWKRIDELAVGDDVVGSGGRSTRVVGVYPSERLDVMRITFDDGSWTRCDPDHLWRVFTPTTRRWYTKTTAELLAAGLMSGGKRRWAIPMVEPVQFPAQDLPIAPYTLGALLGDGSLGGGTANITTDPEVLDMIEREGYTVTRRPHATSPGTREATVLGLRATIIREGLAHVAAGKFIPDAYLIGSVEQRVALLQGLLDTDGSPTGKAAIEWGSVSQRLAEQVRELVQSLGGTAKIKVREPWFTYRGERRQGQTFYRVAISLPWQIPPFLLPRKETRYTPPSKYPPSRRIVSIEPDGYEKGRCIEVAAADHLYVTRDHIVTHNTAQGLVALEMDGLFARRSNILIMCNLTGCQLTWAKELRTRVASQYDVVIADTTLPRGKTLPSLTQRDDLIATQLMDAEESGRPLIVLINFDMLRWKLGEGTKVPTLWEIEWDAVLIDEAHLVLPTSEDKASKLTQFWLGLATLPYRTKITQAVEWREPEEGRLISQVAEVPYEPMKIAMTGTPDRGKLENRYGYWKWFWPESYCNYLSWVQQCFFTEWVERGYNPRTKKPNSVLEIRSRRDPQQWDEYDRIHMLRRTKAEMLAGLPPKQWAEEGGVDLPMTPRQRKAYDDYQADLEAREQQLLADEDFGRAGAAKLLYALRARQMATCLWEIETYVGEDLKEHTTGTPIRAGRDGSNKLAWILDWMEARGYTEANWDPTLGKVVIVSYFTEVLDWLADELAAEGIASATLKGDTPADEKLAMQEAFQEGDLRVILLSGYLGVSINLDAADDMIFLDLVHDPDKVEQAEDRIHRASRDHQTTYWRLVSLDSIDVATVEIVDSRYRLTRASYEGARGVEYARKLLRSTMTPGGTD